MKIFYDLTSQEPEVKELRLMKGIGPVTLNIPTTGVHDFLFYSIVKMTATLTSLWLFSQMTD